MPIYVYVNPGTSPTHVRDASKPRKNVIIYPEHTSHVPIGGLLEVRADNPEIFAAEVASRQLVLRAVIHPSLAEVIGTLPPEVPAVVSPIAEQGISVQASVVNVEKPLPIEVPVVDKPKTLPVEVNSTNGNKRTAISVRVR